MVAVKGSTERKMMLARHIIPFTPIARDGHSEAGTVMSSYVIAAKSRNAGTIRARIAVREVVVGLDRRRATQAAAITKTRFSAHFMSKRHVPKADRMSGRGPNVIENRAAEIASPPMMAMTRPCATGLGRGCDAWSPTSVLIRSSVLMGPNPCRQQPALINPDARPPALHLRKFGSGPRPLAHSSLRLRWRAQHR